MDHFAGVDVSVEETSVCVVDDTSKIVREVKAASEPEALLAVLKNPANHFKRKSLALARNDVNDPSQTCRAKRGQPDENGCSVLSVSASAAV